MRLLVLVQSVTALLLPAAPAVPRALSPVTLLRVTMVEPTGGPDAPVELEQGAKYSKQQLEVAAGASDPFRFVRQIIYGIFSVVGLAGAGIAVMQGDMANAGVNAAVLVGGGVAFVLDMKFQDMLQAKVKEELDDPYIKGDTLLEVEKNEES
eukprot:CAMPEP_0119069568 /NCGR_PEP_ID=MMETSP1178-20130426/24312_1 /TAXON_ID=33656 /ORGANISM="unid sp, Strain CCMP2000" /LENGTH=151 /DNA_ID=CAMNT_0007051343 /DNA_START=23 /DNA_END=478 /DNA_ORIENTATION=-